MELRVNVCLLNFEDPEEFEEMLSASKAMMVISTLKYRLFHYCKNLI